MSVKTPLDPLFMEVPIYIFQAFKNRGGGGNDPPQKYSRGGGRTRPPPPPPPGIAAYAYIVHKMWRGKMKTKWKIRSFTSSNASLCVHVGYWRPRALSKVGKVLFFFFGGGGGRSHQPRPPPPPRLWLCRVNRHCLHGPSAQKLWLV